MLFGPFTFKFIVDGSIGQTEYLKAARIGYNWSGSIDKSMKPASFFDNVRPRLQHQMVGITKHKLQAYAVNHFIIKCL